MRRRCAAHRSRRRPTQAHGSRPRRTRLSQAICVGTPHRVGELLASAHAGALRASAVRMLLLDGQADVKSFTLLTHFEASKQLQELMQRHFLTSSAAAATDGDLSIRVFEYTAPKVS